MVLPKYELTELDRQVLDNEIEATSNIIPHRIQHCYESQSGDVIIQLCDSKTLRNLKLDLSILRKRCLNQYGVPRGLAFMAPSQLEGADYEVRIFFPSLGIDEDIACGSACCSLGRLLLMEHCEIDVNILYPYKHASLNRLGGTMRLKSSRESSHIYLDGVAQLHGIEEISEGIYEEQNVSNELGGHHSRAVCNPDHVALHPQRHL
jgi:predicted PhzF superfamily epimerase YddE/YHI9